MNDDSGNDDSGNDGDEQKYYPWKDGLPTGPDVTLLQQEWDNLQAGDRIEYEDVERVIGTDRRSARWKTVTISWRKREEESGRVVLCDAGKAFYVAMPDQIFARTYPSLQSVGRIARKQIRRLGTIVSSDTRTVHVIEHQARLLQAIEKDSRKKRTNILPPTAADVSPRIEPPKQT